jgi:hypothetical protein
MRKKRVALSNLSRNSSRKSISLPDLSLTRFHTTDRSTDEPPSLAILQLTSPIHLTTLKFNCSMSSISAGDRFQTTIRLKTRAKGCHLITDEIVQGLGDKLKDVKVSRTVFLEKFRKNSSQSNLSLSRSRRLVCSSYSYNTPLRVYP